MQVICNHNSFLSRFTEHIWILSYDAGSMIILYVSTLDGREEIESKFSFSRSILLNWDGFVCVI